MIPTRYLHIIDQNDLGFTKYIYNLIVEVRPECYVDDDCGYSDICYKGSCADACRLSQCGANAKCESSLHSAKCLCLPGYTGNPRSACTLCKSSNYFYRIGKPIVFYSILCHFAWTHKKHVLNYSWTANSASSICGMSSKWRLSSLYCMSEYQMYQSLCGR